MKLAGMALYRYTVPLIEPLTLDGAALPAREGVLVKLTSEGGRQGWGEASPLPGFSRESLEESVRDLISLRAALGAWDIPVCQPPGFRSAFACRTELFDLVPSARFGFELAVWNLCAAVRGTTLPELLGAHPRTIVPLSGLLFGPRERIVRDARRMRRAGYSAVKLKIGRQSLEADVELVGAVEEVLGGAVALRLDANRAWSLREAQEFARRTVRMPFEYVEEPLADPARLPFFVRSSGLPVALDETLAGMLPLALEEHRYARAIVLKPTLLGGISHVMCLANCAHRLGITPVISSSYETGVGTLGLIALASALSEVPAGLDTYRRFAGDVIGPPLKLSSPLVDAAAALSVRREIKHHLLDPIR